MIGAIISAAVQVGSAVYGGIQASHAARKARNMVREQRAKNQAWYDRRYNEDATQRADAQRILSMTSDALKRENKAAQGVAAVMGGTEEGVAAQKAQATQAMADATAQVAAQAEQRKDAIEQAYQARDDEYSQQLQQIENNKANAIAQAVTGAAGAGNNISDLFGQSNAHKQDNKPVTK